MYPAVALVLVAVVLAWPVPRLMARQTTFRRAPGAALLVWQSVTLTAVVAAVAAAPAAALLHGRTAPGGGHPAAGWLAVAVSAGMLARLLVSGHRVGTRLRAVRRRHRDLVDLVGRPDGPRLRVLAHPTPTAYCLPGARSRVVLSRGALETLPPDELAAVLAHERSHLRARHDLVLEFFTVAHEAVPPGLRSPAALHEVRLLVEVLADRAAARSAGVLPTARALVTLAAGTAPEAAMAAAASASDARVRLELLGRTAERPVVLALAMDAFAAVVLLVPVALLFAAG